MALDTEYKHLEARPGSNYRQLFVKGRRIRAIVLRNLTRNTEPRTPEQVAADFDLPVEAVLEAIDYCQRYPEVIEADCQMELDSIREDGLDKPPFVPPGFKPDP